VNVEELNEARKAAQREYFREYYAKNAAKIKAKNRRWWERRALKMLEKVDAGNDKNANN